jgi:hypothetical protein
LKTPLFAQLGATIALILEILHVFLACPDDIGIKIFAFLN